MKLIRLEETEEERNENFDKKGSEYAEIQDGDLLYIHEGFVSAVLLTKEQALRLGKFIQDNFKVEELI